MKYTTAVLCLALVACSKEEPTIRYEVDCTSCAIEYVRGDQWIHDYAKGSPILDTLFAEETPSPVDTGIVDIDTVGWNIQQWRIEFDEREDFAPHLKSRIVPGHSTTARIYEDGVLLKSGSTSTYGEEVSL